MTREEAIKRIERERDFSRNMEKSWGEIDWKDRPDHLADPRKLSANHREYADALDMAIAALKEQTVTNCHQLTIADHIRSMSDEELARFLAEVENRRSAAGGGAVWKGAAHAKEWLKQPYKEDT